jgi:D-sedoheptulose 7-phosphate isomerase|tara:strand:- start:10565 stop:11104 length:540 start_codon:yes stop_codon:yes gene_type:complete
MIDYFYVYFKDIFKSISKIDNNSLLDIANKITKANNDSGKIIIVGNGGSAAIASHVSIDLTKAANIRSINFNEASLLTCFSNDYGYEHWVSKAIEFYANKNDLVIFISSSGQSKNIINGAIKAKELNLPLITLTGFKGNNPLKEMGDINLWVDSSSYNIVETTHQIWLLAVVDYLIESN